MFEQQRLQTEQTSVSQTHADGNTWQPLVNILIMHNLLRQLANVLHITQAVS